MDNIQLTKDSDYLICSLYKNYLQKRNSGITKSQAKDVGSAEDIQQEIFPNWSLDDVEETCRELARADMLHCFDADNTIYMAILSDNAIIYMENRFENKVNTVIDYISKIKSMIPFI